MYVENLPKRLKQARKSAGYSQKQIAEEIEIDRTSLSKYETGEQLPKLETLAQMAQFYNVSLDWLLGVAIQPEPKPEKKSRSERAV